MTVVTPDQLAEINARARSIHFTTTILTVIAALFFSIGFVFSSIWLAIVWCAVATKVGWQAGARRAENDDG
jgi:predicted membrane protein